MVKVDRRRRAASSHCGVDRPRLWRRRTKSVRAKRRRGRRRRAWTRALESSDRRTRVEGTVVRGGRTRREMVVRRQDTRRRTGSTLRAQRPQSVPRAPLRSPHSSACECRTRRIFSPRIVMYRHYNCPCPPHDTTCKGSGHDTMYICNHYKFVPRACDRFT